jgi:hypothetical protein
MLESAEVPVGLASLESPAFRATLHELFALAALEADWDSYGGLPVSAHAISGAVSVAGYVSYLAPGAEPLAVCPLASGGVHLVWANSSGNEIEIDVSPDGSFGFLVVAGVGEERTYAEEGDIDSDGLFVALRSFFHPS